MRWRYGRSRRPRRSTRSGSGRSCSSRGRAAPGRRPAGTDRCRRCPTVVSNHIRKRWLTRVALNRCHGPVPRRPPAHAGQQLRRHLGAGRAGRCPCPRPGACRRPGRPARPAPRSRAPGRPATGSSSEAIHGGHDLAAQQPEVGDAPQVHRVDLGAGPVARPPDLLGGHGRVDRGHEIGVPEEGLDAAPPRCRR